jgi:hypothetical protein
MGLFSTLSNTGAGGEEQVSSTSSSSSNVVPTVVQLYTSTPIQLDHNIAKLSGYSTLTYQAVQVGSSDAADEPKNKHQTPDLGVWNCCVSSNSSTNSAGSASAALVDRLLTKVIKPNQKRVFVLTVDLSQENKVEPDLSLLQSTLVRFLIENPPVPAPAQDGEERKTATTSLYKLQQEHFGLAVEDKKSSSSSEQANEADENIKICVQLCAILPPFQDDNAETAYRTKQARALVIYHLRKYAAAIGASLVFVNSSPSSNSAAAPNAQEEPVEASSTTAVQEQTTVTYEQLSELWRDLANDVPVWMMNESSVEDTAAQMTPIYGPGRHQEDLIESVLLRNAHCTGVWDASKDSLWVALPAPTPSREPETTNKSEGDEGWLGQLRDSIASASEPAPPTPAKDESSKDEAATPQKDAAVSSFFENLLKNP